MGGICDGRVVIVTGAGRGLGREYALEYARQGAKVVVNDLGAELDGTGGSSGPAGEVVDQIRAMGGEAIANGDDVSDWEGAQRLVNSAIETFGGLDVIVNNAGILRDRMLVNMTEEEWDAVIKVHLKGTFSVCRWAATYWRELSKEGKPVDARIINITSPTGLFGNVGQTNYGAAKAGIAQMTRILAEELGRYGVNANVVSPVARTRMTETLNRPAREVPGPGEFDPFAPDTIAPLVAWLGSAEAKDVTGQVFSLRGSTITLVEPWRPGPSADKDERWDPAELGPVVGKLVAEAQAARA